MPTTLLLVGLTACLPGFQNMKASLHSLIDSKFFFLNMVGAKNYTLDDISVPNLTAKIKWSWLQVL